MRKTKIICTLGPRTQGITEQLLLSGMDTARINFSHETREIHKERIEELKALRKKHQLFIPILMDTRGPEIRIGPMQEGTVLKNGEMVSLRSAEFIGNAREIAVNHPDFASVLKPGDSVCIDDGRLRLKVETLKQTEVLCKVIAGGPIGSRKGVNLPGINIALPFLSERDKQDIVFALGLGIDIIALSFVQSAENISEARRFVENAGYQDIQFIAKIESASAVQQIDQIIEQADGIMIARGDLGIELPLSQVPQIQKKLIRKSYLQGKPVITATQMLESMTANPVPTRAEVSDVANAIYDGTSAVMLSGETAAGEYPVETLKTMVEIIREAEASIPYTERFFRESWYTEGNIRDTLGQASTVCAIKMKAKAIIVSTRSGDSARSISRFRPEIPIIAVSVDKRAARQLNMSWGIYPVFEDFVHEPDQLFNTMIECAKKTGIIRDGDLVVLMAGLPSGNQGKTNMLKLHTVGEAVL